jgi:hypothetical protein
MSGHKYLVDAKIFKGELWADCVPYGAISGHITGVIEMLFGRLANVDHKKSQELLKSLMDIQYDVVFDNVQKDVAKDLTATDIISDVSQKIYKFEKMFGVKPTRIHLGKSEFDILENWANQQEYETGFIDSNNCPQLFGIKLSELYSTHHISVS